MKSDPGQDRHRPAPQRWWPAQVLLVGALAGLAGVAGAQTAAIDTGNALSALPTALPYRSAIAGYRPYADPQVESWREANDRVGRIGGWRAYAKEVATGVPAGSQGADPAPPPGERGHGHMNMGEARP